MKNQEPYNCYLVAPLGIEPRSWVPETHILSIVLRSRRECKDKTISLFSNKNYTGGGRGREPGVRHDGGKRVKKPIFSGTEAHQMIGFFRSLRRNLLGENRISRYLLYALGEIVLVVIGILIALQINNWNQRNNELEQEKATARSLKLEFENNLEDLKGDIESIEAIKGAGELLLEYTGPDYVNGTLGSVDSLVAMTVRMSVWDPSLYTLSSIKNSGKLATMSSEDLKLKLIAWETFYANLEDWFDFYVNGGEHYFEYLQEVANGRNLNAGSRVISGKSRFPRSNEDLLRNQTFENNLVDRMMVNGFILGYYQEAKSRLEDIIRACEAYGE